MTLDEDLAKRIAEDAVLSRVLAKADSGTADFTDTSRYHDRMAEIVGAVMREHVLEVPAESRSALCERVLRARYSDSAELLSRVQEALDAALGIRLAPQIPAFQTERVKQIGNSLADQTVSDETIQRRAESASANVVRAFQDRYVQDNARFRSDAGLKCWIVRDAGAKCCDWCAGIDGKYEYGSEPKDVYGRHDNCTCTVTYENGRKRQDVWSKRTWEQPAPDAGAGEAVRFRFEPAHGAAEPLTLSDAQAKAAIAANGLTMPAESGRINYAKVIDSLFYADDYQHETYEKEDIIEHLRTSPVGLDAIKYFETHSEVVVMLSESTESKDRGSQDGNLITIWLKNCPNLRVAAQTVVHEYVHHRYGIGGSQLAEAICFAFEKMHKEGRDYITAQEWEYVKKLAKDNYPRYPWEGGTGDYGQIKLVIKG